MSENCNGSAVRSVVTAFALGALVGTGLALLYAPQSGRETRDMVCKKTQDLKHAAGDAIEQGKHMVSDVRQKAREVIEKGKEAAHEMGDIARSA